jgi:hypothetical protein
VEDLTRCFLAWRVIRAGNREVVEGLVAPEHRGPSAELRQALRAWRHTAYFARGDRSELVLVRPLGVHRPERWFLHLALLLVTVVCALGAGAALAEQYRPPTGNGVMGLVRAGLAFIPDFLQQPPPVILSGWTFAASLLGILLIHELGHYSRAARYGIDVSPPYLLPIPPSLSPIGSLGAFLRLRSPVVDRLQLLDVGAAGPLAGFVVTLGVLAWGYAISTPFEPGFGYGRSFIEIAGIGPVALGDSLLTRAFREYFHAGVASVKLSLPAFAGWAGALITGLNLLPLSQLDGGHVAYSLLGRRQAPLGLVALLGLLYLSQYWAAWLVWVALTLIVGGWRWTHPSVLCPERPVPARRQLSGWLCVLVFAATFVPVPFLR